VSFLLHDRTGVRLSADHGGSNGSKAEAHRRDLGCVDGVQRGGGDGEGARHGRVGARIGGRGTAQTPERIPEDEGARAAGGDCCRSAGAGPIGQDRVGFETKGEGPRPLDAEPIAQSTIAIAVRNPHFAAHGWLA